MNHTTKHPSAPMPAILYGTAWKRERTAELVRIALDAGFRGIDTACQPKHYDEAGVGEGMANAMDRGVERGDLFVQTKFTPASGQDPERTPYDPRAPLAAQVEQSFDASLRNLRTDYVDSLVLHSPLRTLDQTLEVWRAMESLVDQGRVRRLGISNCYDPTTLRALHARARIKPTVVQNRFYAETGYDREIRADCRERGTVYQSFWTLTANPHLLANRQLQDIASTHRRTPAQVLFSFLMHTGITPLTGTKSVEHMREDLAVVEFSLSETERATIDSLMH